MRRMEKGDVKVPIHFFTRALHALGEIRAPEHLFDTLNHEIGLMLAQHLSKRMRSECGNSPGAL